MPSVFRTYAPAKVIPIGIRHAGMIGKFQDAQILMEKVTSTASCADRRALAARPSARNCGLAAPQLWDHVCLQVSLKETRPFSHLSVHRQLTRTRA